MLGADCFTTAMTSGASLLSRSPAAFPGAEGFGAGATGGRGGQVIAVTTTAASGVGSLQWALDQPGPKTVVFRTSGLIDARIHLRRGDVTIAGQTSPGGITIRGFVTDETPFQDQAVRTPDQTAENWILQHIRIRPGPDGPSDDGLRLRYTRNAIVDHVSIGNATDEAVEISYSNNITIQNSIIAETVGSHSFYGGMLLNYSNPAHGFALDNLSIHHNLFSRIEGRLPEASRESAGAAGSVMNLELTSNLYWDPQFFIALAADTGVVTDEAGNPYPVHYRLNATNNVFHAGDNFAYGMWDDQILRAPSAPLNQLFVQGNRFNLYPDRSDYELFYCCNDYAQTSSPDATARLAQMMEERHPFPAITATAAEQLPEVLAERVGAWPRDPMDTRLLDAVRLNRLEPEPLNINPAGDAWLPALASPPPPPEDSDGDGMPDDWELAQGLNPEAANNNAFTLSREGYTDLEVYLHELAALRSSGEPTQTEPAFHIHVAQPSLSEGQTTGNRLPIQISRSGNSNGSASVHWQVSAGPGTAAQAGDFAGGTWPAGVMTLAEGQSSGLISVDLAGDRLAEADETFTITLSNPVGAELTAGQSNRTVTIVNDDWVGGPGADTLIGTAAADFLDGGNGPDVLTGAAGADQFGFRPRQSTIAAPDLITDFRIGEDRIAILNGRGEVQAPPADLNRGATNRTASSLRELAQAVWADADRTRRGNQPLRSNQAVMVRSGHPSLRGTYLLINDQNPMLQQHSDLMIRFGGNGTPAILVGESAALFL